jgi:ferric-dicitrate binding protein FerR (iron transport regulator)
MMSAAGWLMLASSTADSTGLRNTAVSWQAQHRHPMALRLIARLDACHVCKLWQASSRAINRRA